MAHTKNNSLYLCFLVALILAGCANSVEEVSKIPPKPVIPDLPTITISDTTIVEGNTEEVVTITFTAKLNVALDSEVTVEYATKDGTALQPSDYVTKSGTLTFNPQETEVTFAIDVIGDATIEQDEIFTIELSSPSSNVTLGTQILSATGTIINDDYPTVSLAGFSVLEGNSGLTKAQFIVTLSEPFYNDITISYATTDDSATLLNNDYVSLQGSLTMPAGKTIDNIPIEINGDTALEQNESFLLKLVDATNVKGIPVSASGTIMNDDLPVLNIKSQADYVEQDYNNSAVYIATFTISLSEAISTDVAIDYYSADGTAKAGDDYEAVSGSLTFTAGQINKTLPIKIIGDMYPEKQESFTVNINNISTNAIIGQSTATQIIIDNDYSIYNDTGVTTCVTSTIEGLACNNSSAGTDILLGQDAEFGRDKTNNDDSDGHAGFSFSKIGANGIPLADQSLPYSIDPWDCVQDNVTGLIWEVKIKSNRTDLRDVEHTYTWYDSSGPYGTIEGSIHYCVGITQCNTEYYVSQINTVGLCGYQDWRLPTVRELLSITDSGLDPQIDINYFPNIGAAYWCRNFDGFNQAWYFAASKVSFGNYEISKADFAWQTQVMLVRGGK